MNLLKSTIYTRTALWWFGLAMTITLAAVLSGCQETKDFLYYDRTPSTPLAQETYKVSEAVTTSAAAFDILFVVDNSGSMASYQKDLIANSDLFINELVKGSRQTPWRIGMISTDEDQDAYLSLSPIQELTNRSADPVSIFNSAVARLGTSGSAYEKTFRPVLNFVESTPKFFNPSATLAIVVITDAPEQSMTLFRTGGRAPVQTDVDTFIDRMLKVKGGDSRKLVAYGAFATRTECNTSDEPWEWAGSVYEQLITRLQGSHFWICDPNFGAELAKIAKDLVKRVDSPRFFIKQRPRIETLVVSYQGMILPGAGEPGAVWYYDAEDNAVVMTDMTILPDFNAKVDVTYKVDNGFVER